MHEPIELSYAECLSRLVKGKLGRVAVSTPNGPRIIPLNYTVMDDAVLFRTTPYSLVGTYARNTTLAFEVDEIDTETHRGWSVVAVGRAVMVEDSDELSAIKAAWDPTPWADGQRRTYFRLTWRELTGRKLSGDS